MLIPSQSWGEDIAVDSSLVKMNLDIIKEKIAHYNIKIIAVTKYFGLRAIEAGYEAGLRLDRGHSASLAYRLQMHRGVQHFPHVDLDRRPAGDRRDREKSDRL